MRQGSARGRWIEMLRAVAEPVLSAGAKRELKAAMPVESKNGDRRAYAHLEAVGRTLTGLAPFLELRGGSDEERALREGLALRARLTLEGATDPDSPDFANFTEGDQPIVDAAFLAQAVLRAPGALWHSLDGQAKEKLADALAATRIGRKPAFSNWLLFSATIEAALCKMGRDWDRMRVDYALRQHEQWYVGDGFYSDGPRFHADYYNSFVIQPMLLDVLAAVGDFDPAWKAMKEPVLERARRYAAVLEGLISPEGSFPLVGRSITYRMACFQLLGQAALLHALPEGIEPAQVRCALTAVYERMLSFPGTFGKDGWLKIGVCGAQPGLGEGYICTGSLYLCTTGFLPLGLPPEDPFWSGDERDWTSKRLWRGEDGGADGALHD